MAFMAELRRNDPHEIDHWIGSEGPGRGGRGRSCSVLHVLRYCRISAKVRFVSI